MSGFLKNIVVLISVVLGCYLILFFVFRYADNHLMREKVNEQQHIIFGNSHAMSSMDPELISKLTGDEFRSYASNGQAMFWTVKGIEKKIAQIDHPIIYVEFTNNSFTTDWWIYDDTRVLREIDKLYQLSWEEFSYLLKNNPGKTIKFLATLPFPSTKLDGKFGINEKNRLKEDIKDRGERIKVQYTALENENDVDLGVNSLKRLIEAHPEIKFVLVRTPMHPQYFEILKGINNDEKTLKWLGDFSKKSNCKVFDFAHLPLHDSCFADLDHLNYKGAKVFSEIFSDSLLNLKKK